MTKTTHNGMSKRALLALLPDIMREINKDFALRAKDKVASGMAREGFDGGYLEALQDVEAALRHGYPSDTRNYWSRALASKDEGRAAAQGGGR